MMRLKLVEDISNNVLEKDSFNASGKSCVTFYDNGRYKLEEDLNGEGVIAYHGSNAKFNKFDMKYFGRTDDGMWGKGIYFISDKRVAQSFGSDYLYTCRLKLNKPYIIDMSTVGNNEDSEDSSKYYSLTNRNNDVLKRKGYDSIIVKLELWEGSFTTRANEYIVFDPSDIEILDVKALSLEEDYDPPYNAQQIKDNYGIELYNKLIRDPAHRWRMETGIELIHKEPTKEELERIWKNWQEMSKEQKEKSDKKSLELFGKTNEENYYDLIKLYESVNSNKNIDDIETPEELMDWMEENITYELANDEYGAEDDPPTKTAEEVIKTGTGHCAEQSYLEYKVLDDLGYFPQLIFVKENNSEDDYGADGSAHMFVVYQNDDEEYTYFEHSQEHNKGIHKFDSMSELLDFVGKNWWRYDANSDILEVRYIDEPITGVDNWELAKECHKYPVDEVLDISNNVMEEDVPLDAKWDPYKHQIIEESLTEAKKSKNKKKKKKIDYTEFNTPAKLKAWVKKRLKGLSPFTYLNPNAGNVEYNQSMFNQMMGSADGASSVGISDGGISNGGLSAPAGDGGGMAMGESLSNNNEEKTYIEISSSSYFRLYKHLLDDHLDEFIAELYKFCDEKVYLNIINMLKEAGIELPKAQQVLDRMIELGYVKDAQKSTLLLLEKDLGR